MTASPETRAARRAGCLAAPHPVFGLQHGRVHEDEVRHRAHKWDELHEDPGDLVLIGIAPDGVAMVGGIKNAPRHRQKDERPAVVQQDHWGIEPKGGRDEDREEERRQDPQDDPNLATHVTIVYRPSRTGSGAYRQPAPHGEPAAEELEPYLVSVGSRRELWKPWANDAESFERAVLADLERRVSKPVAAYLMREPAGREFREARLDGSYPKTVIVVSFLNLHTESVEESQFPLWQEEGYRSGGGVIDPESIAADIWIWLIEPL